MTSTLDALVAGGRVAFSDVSLVIGGDPTHAPSWFATLFDMEGWSDSAPDTSDAAPHWGGQGLMMGVESVGGRVVRLKGRVHARSMHHLEAGKRAMKASLGVLTVQMPGDIALEASARATISFEYFSPTSCGFTWTLLADDPLRYSATAQTLVNGANALVNQGDRTAWPVIEVPGPHGAITVAHAGSTWTLAANAAATLRTVDLRNGDVWQGGVRVFGVESGAAPSVPVGEATWTVAGLGAGGARVRRFGAWS